MTITSLPVDPIVCGEDDPLVLGAGIGTAMILVDGVEVRPSRNGANVEYPSRSESSAILKQGNHVCHQLDGRNTYDEGLRL